MQVPVHDAARVESEIHQYFNHRRVRGEWFEFDSMDYSGFKQMVRASDAGISPNTIPKFGGLQLEMVINMDRRVRGQPSPPQND